MTFQSILWLFFEFKTIFISLFISYLIYKLVRFYQSVRSFPPGPFPLPIIGNAFLFMGKDNWETVYKRNAKLYGSVFTIWFGPKPMVIISDLEIGRKVFSKIEFSGRHQTFLSELFSNEKHKDLAFSSGEIWEVLRKATYSAAQKYATNERLTLLTSDCVENTINEIISKEGVEQEFSSYEYINSLVINIVTKSVYGGRGGVDLLHKYTEIFMKGELMYRMVLWISSPIIRFLDFRALRKLNYVFDETFNYSKEIFENHYKDYDESIERDFCDALITAKKEALKAGKDSLKYLIDDNLSMVLLDLFIAGSSTTVESLQWIILFMTYYPEFQQKIRQEIENQIGDRIPTHEDRNRCHFIMAFISEVMRLKNVVPGGLPHATMVNCELGNYSIPKGTGIIVFQDMILTDEKYWPNAHEFRPQRFLENGQYITRRPKAFIPFGTGRRVCVGEKLAMANMFLIIVRFLQLTNEYELVLGSNSGLIPASSYHLERPPAEFKIILRKRSVL